MIKCGLLGRKLGHSYSPQIHAMLGDYEYTLFEKEETELGEFLEDNGLRGLNVTIPYKKTVIPYLSALGEYAKKTGSVNTIIRREDGSLFGDNTDIYGFTKLAEHSGIEVKDSKVLVLGSGGAASAVIAALEEMQAETVVISRSGENNYENISRHADAGVIVNTTPLGMYPNTGVSPVDLTGFPKLKGVIDAVYNPARTRFLLQAESLGIKNENGLYMLVAQAKRGSELFTGRTIPDSEIDRVYNELRFSSMNIVLIGMPGVGKSTVAGKIAELTGRKFFDSDEEITRRTGTTPAQIIVNQGENEFRKIETDVLRELGKQSESVIATGGGAVVREENYNLLHQNGTIVWLQRDGSLLPDTDRPITQKTGVEELYRQRRDKYERFADVTLSIGADEKASAEEVLEAVRKIIPEI